MASSGVVQSPYFAGYQESCATESTNTSSQPAGSELALQTGQKPPGQTNFNLSSRSIAAYPEKQCPTSWLEPLFASDDFEEAAFMANLKVSSSKVSRS